MAIAITNLTSGGDTGSNPSTTASISPTSGAVVIAAVGCAVIGGDTTHPSDSLTISGCGLTWTQLATTAVAAEADRRRLFVWKGVGTPSSGTLSISFSSGGGGTWTENAWSIDQITGADETTPLGGPDVTSLSSAGTSLSVTVDETPDAGDYVYAAFRIESTGTSPSLNSELSNQLALYDSGTDVRAMLTAYDSTPDSTPTPGITWTGSNFANGIAFIVNAAAAGGSHAAVASYLSQLRRR